MSLRQGVFCVHGWVNYTGLMETCGSPRVGTEFWECL